jgi:hypothetical protein
MPTIGCAFTTSRNQQFAGIDAVEGELVTVHTAVSSNGRRVSWRAPDLACEELYSRYETQQGDSRFVMVEKKTTKLVVGDPDPALFAIPRDYVESKPSVALMAALTAVGLPIPEDERTRIAKEGAELDKRYPRRAVAPDAQPDHRFLSWSIVKISDRRDRR